MDIVAHDPYLPDDVFELVDVESVSLEELLIRSDAISVHALLTESVHHTFDADAFERMRDEAVLVNTGRGPIIDEAALVEAVESGAISAVALDVFESEPPEGSPAPKHDRIVCSPHRPTSPPVPRSVSSSSPLQTLRPKRHRTSLRGGTRRVGQSHFPGRLS